MISLKNVKTYSVFFAAAVIASLFFGVMPAKAFSTVELEGYAWSANTGWVSMNCSNAGECGTSDYKVQINPDKTLSGYAWSANIGWIQFGGLSGFPASGSNAAVTGTYDTNWGFDGWARALAYGDGWDGWISLSGIAVDASPYTVGFSTTGNMNSDSYAWGADVVGWVNFASAFFAPPYTAGNSCTADYLGTIYTDMWGDVQPAAATVCDTVLGEVCIDANPVCAVVTIAGSVTATPPLVRTDDKVNISWTIDDPTSVDSCRVESNDGGSWANNPSESSPLTFKTNIFTLYCIPAGGGPEIEVDSQEVKLLPHTYEI